MLQVLVAWAIVALLVVVFRPMNVRAVGTGVNLDQWATIDAAWQNGDLNGNNSAYPEGGVVPFRLAIEGLNTGSHTIHINYDFTAGGHKAYDFLASWNAWRSPPLCGTGGGGRSSMCPGLPGSSSHAFPADPYVANGLSVTGAEVWSGMSRRLTIWGGTITSISGPVHGGSVNANSTADYVVHFTSTGSAVLLAWGGHLAQSGYWDRAAGGARDGASTVSGAPWHMRTLNLDNAGARNQDRSIQRSAIVGELAVNVPATPTPRPTAPQAPGPTPTRAPGTTNPPNSPATPRPFFSPPPTSTLGRDIADGDAPDLRLFVLLSAVGGIAAWRGIVARRGRGAPRN
ncbi:MAG: hypothetical protein E6J17_01545 [Chloroflexi bacterium]|nr:MAG: hypothetical protein E6J17_01545 [Chloroflexota bacterium]